MPEEHDYANAVMLFRKDPAGDLVQNRILVLGGQKWNSDNQTVVVNDAVREFKPGTDASITGTGTWSTTNTKKALAEPRVFANSVLLPDGKILVVGGSRTPAYPPANTPPNTPSPVFQPELYDPGDTPDDEGSTKLLAPSRFASWGPMTRVPRLYHSMALLLPDGRVFVVGGKFEFANQVTYSEPRLSGELFYPPYLFVGNSLAQRPSINGVTLSNTTWQQLSTQSQPATFSVVVTTLVGPVKKVTLTRVSSVTLHFDSDQRFIELDHTGSTQAGIPSTLTVTSPREDMAPQGYYYLWVLEEKSDGRLIPSIAEIVQFI